MSSLPELFLHFTEVKSSSPSGATSNLFLDVPWEAVNPLCTGPPWEAIDPFGYLWGHRMG
ncbi:MAG: hypothetical protein MJE68_25130 [Proteobacteria bacterium]|nr:hypothetical protein [Pseudomonadota bacterium]